MNFADLESLWRSPHNRPSAAELEKTRMQFLADLRRRRRGNAFFLIFSALPLVVFTALLVRHFFAPAPGDAPWDFSREWALIPLYLLPWAGWFAILRLHRRHVARYRDTGRSISRSVEALLDENRSERARYRSIAGLLLASLVVLPLVTLQLRDVGKAGDEILVPFLVGFPTLLLGIVAGMAWHYARRLLPRGRHLETVIAAYREHESGAGAKH